MITAVHTLVYADDAETARVFFRDILGWPHVDAHEGWLIFRTGPSEMGVHPADGGGQHHEVSLMCDDIEAQGVRFAGRIEDRAFGRTIALEIPGAGQMLLYEPRHPTAFDL